MQLSDFNVNDVGTSLHFVNYNCRGIHEDGKKADAPYFDIGNNISLWPNDPMEMFHLVTISYL